MTEAETIILGTMRPGREYSLPDIKARLENSELIPDTAISAVLRGLVKTRRVDLDHIGTGASRIQTWRVREGR